MKRELEIPGFTVEDPHFSHMSAGRDRSNVVAAGEALSSAQL